MSTGPLYRASNRSTTCRCCPPARSPSCSSPPVLLLLPAALACAASPPAAPGAAAPPARAAREEAVGSRPSSCWLSTCTALACSTAPWMAWRPTRTVTVTAACSPCSSASAACTSSRGGACCGGTSTRQRLGWKLREGRAGAQGRCWQCVFKQSRRAGGRLGNQERVGQMRQTATPPKYPCPTSAPHPAARLKGGRPLAQPPRSQPTATGGAAGGGRPARGDDG